MRNRCVWRALYDLEDFAGLESQLEKQCGQPVYVSGALSILCFRSESAFPFSCPSGNNSQILEKKKRLLIKNIIRISRLVALDSLACYGGTESRYSVRGQKPKKHSGAYRSP